MINREHKDKSVAFLYTLKDRSNLVTESGESLRLLSNCVFTLTNALRGFDFANVEFHFADFGSTDCPIEEEIKRSMAEDFKVFVHNVPGPFGRGPGFNHILDNAELEKHDCLVFVDADMLFTRELVLNKGFDNSLNKNTAYFPVCCKLSDHGPTIHPITTTGFGNCFVPATHVRENNIRFIDKYTWGREDSAFAKELSKHCECKQELVAGFYHQWHPDVAVKD